MPVYTVCGPEETVSTVEKFALNILHVPNLYILDHRSSYVIHTPGSTTIRLFGLGGAYVPDRLFNVGSDGSATVAGEMGKIWITLPQVGELLDLADRYSHNKEMRVFVANGQAAVNPFSVLLSASLNAQILIISPGASQSPVFMGPLSGVHSEASLESLLVPVKAEIGAMWQQIYLVAISRFSETQRKQCMRVINSIIEMPFNHQQIGSIIYVCAPSSDRDNQAMSVITAVTENIYLSSYFTAMPSNDESPIVNEKLLLTPRLDPTIPPFTPKQPQNIDISIPPLPSSTTSVSFTSNFKPNERRSSSEASTTRSPTLNPINHISSVPNSILTEKTSVESPGKDADIPTSTPCKLSAYSSVTEISETISSIEISIDPSSGAQNPEFVLTNNQSLKPAESDKSIESNQSKPNSPSLCSKQSRPTLKHAEKFSSNSHIAVSDPDLKELTWSLSEKPSPLETHESKSERTQIQSSKINNLALTKSTNESKLISNTFDKPKKLDTNLPAQEKSTKAVINTKSTQGERLIVSDARSSGATGPIDLNTIESCSIVNLGDKNISESHVKISNSQKTPSFIKSNKSELVGFIPDPKNLKPRPGTQPVSTTVNKSNPVSESALEFPSAASSISKFSSEFRDKNISRNNTSPSLKLSHQVHPQNSEKFKKSTSPENSCTEPSQAVNKDPNALSVGQNSSELSWGIVEEEPRLLPNNSSSCSPKSPANHLLEVESIVKVEANTSATQNFSQWSPAAIPMFESIPPEAVKELGWGIHESILDPNPINITTSTPPASIENNKNDIHAKKISNHPSLDTNNIVADSPNPVARSSSSSVVPSKNIASSENTSLKTYPILINEKKAISSSTDTTLISESENQLPAVTETSSGIPTKVPYSPPVTFVSELSWAAETQSTSSTSKIDINAPAFYIDKESSSKKRGDECIIMMRGLPAHIQGIDLDECLLKPYAVSTIDFLSKDNTIAAVTFETPAAAKQAFSDLEGVSINDHSILISLE